MKHFKKTIIIGLIGLIVSCMPNNKVEKKSDASASIDTVKVIETGVDYVFKTIRFADDYYLQPLKIVTSKNVPSYCKFNINGLKTELVSEKPDSKIINDWKNPKPYVEILELKKTDKDRILLNLLFRTTGNEFTIWLKNEKKGCLTIDSLSHSKI